MSNYGGGSDDEERKAELPKCTLTRQTRSRMLPLLAQLSSKFLKQSINSKRGVVVGARRREMRARVEQKRKMWEGRMEGDGMSVRAC